MSNPSSDSYRNPLRFTGQDYSFAPRYVRNRDPLSPTNASRDIKPKENQGYYPLGSIWNNSANGNVWILSAIVNNLANWVLIGSSNGNVLTLSDNAGTTVDPALSTGNIQLTGQVNNQTGSFSTVVADAANNLIILNPMSPARWIVDQRGSTIADRSNGTHSTIASAIASATSGDTILIMPGSYTEDLTLKAGVNLAAFDGDSATPTVTINGLTQLATAGTASISNIQLVTNGNFCLGVTGSTASILNVFNCNIIGTINSCIINSSSSASAQLNLYNCTGNQLAAGHALFTHTGAGFTGFNNCQFGNASGNTTAASVTNGACNAINSTFLCPITFSSTGAGTFSYCNITTTATNTIALTLGGASTAFFYCVIASGTAQAVAITSAANQMTGCFVSTTNNPAIGGAGTLTYSPIAFGLNSNMSVTVTTQNILGYGPNVPNFSATKSGNSANATGNGAVATVICDTETYDVLGNYNNATGVFTAPITGKYELIFKIYITSCTIATTCTANIVTTARTYSNQFFRAAGNQDIALQVTCIANMTATDTASFTVVVSGEGGDTDTVLGNNDYTGTWVQGRYLGTN